MYQSLIILLLTGSFSWAASPQEVTKIYADFEEQKAELLKSDLSKKTNKEKAVASYKALEKALDEVKAIEAKTPKNTLTVEGNQMAYDLEILSPIKDLAAGLTSPEDCTKARHEHSLNFPVVEDDDSKAIEAVINKACK